METIEKDNDPKTTGVYCVLRNIPTELHSADLRNYFSQFIESDGFKCFHFRHRPEVQKTNISNTKIICENQNEIESESNEDCRNPDNESGVLHKFSLDDISHRCQNKSQESKQTMSTSLKQKSTSTTCCVILVKHSRILEFIQKYHRKHWLDRNGDHLPSLCYIEKFSINHNQQDSRVDDNESASQDKLYKTRAEHKKIDVHREAFTQADLEGIPELNPPPGMPRGNVGTPTRYFLTLIKQCRLPAAVVKKLGLIFPRKRPRKQFSTVPYAYEKDRKFNSDVLSQTTQLKSTKNTQNKLNKLKHSSDFDKLKHAPVNRLNTMPDYDSDIVSSTTENETSADSELGNDSVTDASGHQIVDEKDYDLLKSQQNQRVDEKTRIRRLKDEGIEEKLMDHSSDSNDDADECQEWERHEAFCDDPGTQERNKERLFEEEIELKWEKGGSGLVFYTDAQFWAEKEGDFDEQTADDWDVDMSVYYDKSAGDMDSRDMLAMRREKKLREGGTERETRRKWKDDDVGLFEQHTKGIGRKIMSQQGWRDGGSLGGSVQGVTEALGNEGQSGRDKSGFGFLSTRRRSFEGKVDLLRIANIVLLYGEVDIVQPANCGII